MSNIQIMNNHFEIDFSRLTSIEDLAYYIGTSNDLLLHGVSLDEKKLFYKKHKIPKRGKNSQGQYRIVWEILDKCLLRAHKNFARKFGTFSKKYIHPSAVGYIKNQGIRENAQAHSGASFLLRADLSNFFLSICSKKLFIALENMGLQHNIIEALVKFLTINNSLPLGFPSSPMLSNIVCKQLDEKISELALKYACKYTRYADDIAISGNNTLPTKEELAEILYQENFELCENKFRITKVGQAHYVTGLSISDNKMPHAPRKLKKELKQELYYCRKFGIKNHFEKKKFDSLNTILKDSANPDINKYLSADLYIAYNTSCFIQKMINCLHGMVCYVSHIEKKPMLLKGWHYLLATNKCNITHTRYNDKTLMDTTQSLILPPTLKSNTEKQELKSVLFYVDETEIEFNSNKYLALAFTSIENNKVEIISKGLEALLNKYIIDPYTGSKKRELEKKNLHYNDADHELKSQCISYLYPQNLSNYIVYGLLEEDKYESTYLDLIQKILPKILSKKIYNALPVTLNFEQNSKINLLKLTETSGNIWNKLSLKNSIRPTNIETKQVSKTEYCLSVPDFMLGVFRKYVNIGNKKDTFEERMFEKLRDQYTLILNADCNIRYTRKNPFTNNLFILVQ
jgi:RNA-directed DNA polymerase